MDLPAEVSDYLEGEDLTIDELITKIDNVGKDIEKCRNEGKLKRAEVLAKSLEEMNEIYNLYTAHIRQENQAQFEALHSYLEEEDLTLSEFFEKRISIIDEMKKCEIEGKLKRLTKLEKDLSRMEEVFRLAEEYATRHNPSNAYVSTDSPQTDSPQSDNPQDAPSGDTYYSENIPPIPPPSNNDSEAIPQDNVLNDEWSESQQHSGTYVDSEPVTPPPPPVEPEQKYNQEDEEIFHDCPGDFNVDSSSASSAAPDVKMTEQERVQTSHNAETYSADSKSPGSPDEKSNASNTTAHDTQARYPSKTSPKQEEQSGRKEYGKGSFNTFGSSAHEEVKQHRDDSKTTANTGGSGMGHTHHYGQGSSSSGGGSNVPSGRSSNFSAPPPSAPPPVARDSKHGGPSSTIANQFWGELSPKKRYSSVIYVRFVVVPPRLESMAFPAKAFVTVSTASKDYRGKLKQKDKSYYELHRLGDTSAVYVTNWIEIGEAYNTDCIMYRYSFQPRQRVEWTEETRTIPLPKSSRVICDLLVSMKTDQSTVQPFPMPLSFQIFSLLILIKHASDKSSWLTATLQLRHATEKVFSDYPHMKLGCDQVYEHADLLLSDADGRAWAYESATFMFGMLARNLTILEPSHYPVVLDVTRRMIAVLSSDSQASHYVMAQGVGDTMKLGIELMADHNATCVDFNWVLLDSLRIHLETARAISTSRSVDIQFKEQAYVDLKAQLSISHLMRGSKFLISVLDLAPSHICRKDMLLSWKDNLCDRLFRSNQGIVTALLEALTLNDLLDLASAGIPQPATTHRSESGMSFRRMFVSQLCAKLLTNCGPSSSSGSDKPGYVDLAEHVNSPMFPMIMDSLRYLGINSPTEAHNLHLRFLSSVTGKWISLRVLLSRDCLSCITSHDLDIADVSCRWLEACSNDCIVTLFACTTDALQTVEGAKRYWNRDVLTQTSKKITEFCRRACEQQVPIAYLKSLPVFCDMTSVNPQARDFVSPAYCNYWKVHLKEHLKQPESWTNIIEHINLAHPQISEDMFMVGLQALLDEFSEAYCARSSDWTLTLSLLSKTLSKFWTAVLVTMQGASPQFGNRVSAMQHPTLTRVSTALTLLLDQCNSGTITLREIGDLVNVPDYAATLSMFSAMYGRNEMPPQHFSSMASVSSEYRGILQIGHDFVTSYFSGAIQESSTRWTASGLDEVLREITVLREASDTMPLRAAQQAIESLRNPENLDNIRRSWRGLSNVIPVALKYSPLLKSSIFRNALDMEVKVWNDAGRGNPTVDEVCEVAIPEAVRRINDTFAKFAHPSVLFLSQLFVLCKDAIVTGNIIDELACIQAFFVSAVADQYQLIYNGLILFQRVTEIFHATDAFLKLSLIFRVTVMGPVDIQKVRRSCDVSQFEHVTLADLQTDIAQFDHTFGNVKDAHLLFVELSGADSLIDFAKDVANETQFNLIDSVEDFGESVVSVEVVSDFDMVRRLLKEPLLLAVDPHATMMSLVDLLHHIREQAMALGVNSSGQGSRQNRQQGTDETTHHNNCFSLLAMRVHECREHAHSLRDLYDHVSRRQELTKAIIFKLISGGHYKFEIVQGKCEISASIIEDKDGSEKEQTYPLDRLLDLKGRALLQINSNKKVSDDSGDGSEDDSKAGLQSFLDTMVVAMDIMANLNSLIKLGHFKYSTFTQCLRVDVSSLMPVADSIQMDMNLWRDALRELRDERQDFNYIFGDQVCALYNFMVGNCPVDSMEVKIVVNTVLSVSSTGSIDDIMQYYGKCSDITDPDFSSDGAPDQSIARLKRVVDELCKLFSDVGIDAAPNIRQDAITTEHNGVLIVTYQHENELFPTVFSVFASLCQLSDLKRHRLLICDKSTEEEEIVAFAKRAFAKQSSKSGVFCVINSYSLSHDMRTRLTDALLRACDERHEDCKSLVFILALDSRSHKNYFDELKLPIHPINLVTPEQVQQTFRRDARNICVVFSDRAGIGKTEYIRGQADRRYDKRILTVPVGDGASRLSFATNLSSMSPRHDECIHFDVSDVEDRRGINLAFFELLALGCLQVGSTVLNVPRDIVCFIEIANTYSAGLRNALTILNYFNQHHLQWNLESLVISQEKNSDLQVVCNYLKHLKANDLASHEIVLNGPSCNVEVLQKPEVLVLIREYFFNYLEENAIPATLNVMYIFLGVLADQLRRFSKSAFFRIKTMKDYAATRQNIVGSLVEHCREFSTRSLAAAKSKQDTSMLNDIVEFMPTGLVRWEDNNQVMVLMHTQGSITALYRDSTSLDDELKTIMESQINKRRGDKLPDYFSMESDELKIQLSKFAFVPSDNDEANAYVLTPDNFLKIVMIFVRVDAGLPVILMGETGCGKTSLIRYASILRGVDLFILNIHAGRTESEIVDFIVQCEEKAKKHQVWVFLDEINTCNHMGLINRLICHRILNGRRVARNIAFFAASNPYRLKSGKTISAGLDTQQKKVPDKMSKLVYRVYPLPDTMMNYLWDFGSLAAEDEEYYIRSIYADLCDHTPPLPPKVVDVLVDIVVVSHAFLRAREDVSAVSMRDVRRCKKLVEWFIKNKQAKPKREGLSYMSRLYRSFGFYTNTQSTAQETAETLSIAAVILGIAHCYRSRLPEVGLRDEYDNRLVEVFHQHEFRSYSADRIRAEITNEQMDYLNRMDLGPGIAKNDALLENIFVLLVCILVKMPIFLVGKPGSSKTLAMKRIEANLRGPDAKDAFFRLHNEVKVVSYQGSVSSTSEGVLQAFAKAKSYAESSDKSTVVVLFDEVGLAEISPWNPLKVLHALLEKSDFEVNDDVSVVGLSNWSLDAAKMNRAIHISRPEPDLKQLHETSIEIFRSLSDGRAPNDTIVGVLQGISQAYLEFYTDQLKSINHKNFHGLRDFYSCVKHIGKQCQFFNVSDGMIAEAVSRNFNGLLPGPENAFDRLTHNATRNASYSVKDLVAMNLKDKNCRHLLLITVGDTILNTVDSIFRDCGLGSPRIIIGSKLRGDQHESYHYRLLSEIIECMEIGTCIVLKDLDPIYGSLYDMLNQAYTMMANKLHCRVALGAFSNPMCCVHDSFKCVVIVEQSKVDKLDPPFLNRFEKQRLNFSSFLNAQANTLLRRLKDWVLKITSFPPDGNVPRESHFLRRDVLPGFGENTLESIVAALPMDSDGDAMLRQCQEIVMKTASVDGILRILASVWAKTDKDGAKRLVRETLQDYGHANLSYAVDAIEGLTSSKNVVTTFTPLHFFSPTRHLSEKYHSVTDCKTLESFDTESSLVSCLRSFYSDPQKSYLLFLSNAYYDKDILLLAKFIVDREENEWSVSRDQSESTLPNKHVFFLVHISRTADSQNDDMWEICFCQGWQFRHIDSLLTTTQTWTSLIDLVEMDSIAVALDSPGVFDDCVRNEMLPCFSQFRYVVPVNETLGKSQADRVKLICANISTAFIDLVRAKIKPVIIQKMGAFKSHWIVNVAVDRELLELSSFSLAEAVPKFIQRIVHDPLLVLLHQLEQQSCLDMWTQMSSPCGFYNDMFLSNAIVNMTNIGPIGFTQCLEVESVIGGLRYPFSMFINSLLSEIKQTFISETKVELAKLRNEDSDRNEGAPNSDSSSVFERIRDRARHPLRAKLDGLIQDIGVNAENADQTFITDVRLRQDIIRQFVASTNRCSMAALDLGTSIVEKLLGLLVFGSFDYAEGSETTDICDAYILLWEHSQLFSAILDVVDVIFVSNSSLDIFDVLSKALTGHMHENFSSSDRLKLAQLLAYEVGHLCCLQIIGFCSPTSHNSYVNLRTFFDNVEEWIATIKHLLMDIADLCLDRDLYDLDPKMRLLDSYYVLRVLRDVCLFDSTGARTSVLCAIEDDQVTMDDRLFDIVSNFLSGLIDSGNNDGEIHPAAEVLSNILEWFLFVAFEKASVTDDASTAFIAHPMFAVVSNKLLALKNAPPTALSKPLHLLLSIVNDVIYSHYDSTEGDICDSIVQGAFPDILSRELRSFSDVCSSLRGSVLEVLVLDVLMENFLFGPDSDDEDSSDRINQFISAAERNIEREENCGSDKVLIVWFSHAIMKNFLQSTAVILTSYNSNSEAVLHLTNDLLGFSRDQSDVLSMFRTFFIKSLGGDMNALISSCSEGGRFAETCVWMRHLNWPSLDTEGLVKCNPRKNSPYWSECESAWDAVNSTPSSPDELTALVGSITTLDPQTALSKADTLLWCVFTKRCRDTISDHRTVEGIDILSGLLSSPGPIKSLGRLCLLSSSRFECVRELMAFRANDPISFPTTLMSFVLEVVAACSTHPTCQLASYYHDPTLVNGLYVVGAQSKPLQTKELATRYQCSCGLLVWVSGKCETCTCACGQSWKRSQGGESEHKQGTGSGEGNVKGFTFLNLKMKDPAALERLLSPMYYRVLVLLVHSCMFASWLMREVDATSTDAVEIPPEIAQHWEWMYSSWSILCTSLVSKGRADLLGHTLHSVIQSLFANPALGVRSTTAEKRLQWEIEFSKECDQHLNSAVLLKSTSFEESCISNLSTIEKDIFEYVSPNSTSYAKLFYRTTIVARDISSLANAYYRNPRNRENYPLIHFIVEHQHILKVLTSLQHLVSWTNSVRRQINMNLTRDDAHKTSHRTLWQRNVSSTFDLNEDHFKRFKSAWENLHSCYREDDPSGPIFTHENFPSIVMWELSPETPVICSAVGATDDGLLVSIMMNKLAILHNSFINAAQSLLASSPSSQDPQGEFSSRRISHEVPLQDASSCHFLEGDMTSVWKQCKKYGRRKLDYGYGHEFEFDFANIQAIFVEAFVAKKAIFSRYDVNELVSVHFKNETFSNHTRMMDTLELLIPQCPLPEGENFKQDPCFRDINEVSNRLIPAVEAALFMLVEANVRRDPEMLIVDFARTWLDDINANKLTYYEQRSIVGRLRLKHLEALYELLEDTTGEIVLKHIDDRFGRDMSKPFLVKLVDQTLAYLGNDIKMLLSSWQRFVTRYLRNPNPLPPERKIVDFIEFVRMPAGKHLMESEEVLSLWRECLIENSLTILREIKIRWNAEEEVRKAADGAHSSSHTESKTGDPAPKPVVNKKTRRDMRYRPSGH